MVEQPVLAAAWKAPALVAIAEAELQTSWSPVGPGTIPTRARPGDSGGMWRASTSCTSICRSFATAVLFSIMEPVLSYVGCVRSRRWLAFRR